MSEAISGSPGGERWLPVVGYEGMYEVSDQGRVRSLDRVDSRGWKRKGQVLKLHPGDKWGHLSACLSSASTVRRYYVHRLQAMAFIGPPPFEGAVVRHLDDDKTNNTLENLAWGTHAENSADMVRNGNSRRLEAVDCPYGVPKVRTGIYQQLICRACDNARGVIAHNGLDKESDDAERVRLASHERVAADTGTRKPYEFLTGGSGERETTD